jgi:hypothetical protein
MISSLTLQDWAHVAEIFIALGTAATAVVAAAALLFAKRQLRQAELADAQSTQDRALADTMGTYRSLMEKALEYPEFIAPDPSLINVTLETFDGSEKEFRRYEAFVELMLTTFEAAEWLPQSEFWTSYVVQWLGEHETYLASDYFKNNFQAQISPELERLLKKAFGSESVRKQKRTRRHARKAA